MGKRRKVFLALMICVLTVVLVTPVTVFSVNGTTEVVSTESTGSSAYPSLAVDSNGSVHIAWEDYTDIGGAGTDADIFYKVKTAGGTWPTTTEIVSTGFGGGSYRASLAVDSDGNVHIAWYDNTDIGGAGTDWDIFYRKYDVVTGWAVSELVSTESTGTSYGPSLAVDSDENVHIAWIDSTGIGGAGTDYDIFYKLKTAGGTWPTTTEIVSTESTGSSYNPRLDVDSDGKVHVAWYDSTDIGGAGTDYDIFYKVRGAAGSWTTTEVVSTESTGTSYSPSLAVDSDENVHIAWIDSTNYTGCGTDYDIFYKLKTAGGTWPTTTEVVSTESTGTSSNPSLAVDSDENVHIAWEDYTDIGGAGTDYDIFYKVKGAGGTWPTTTEIVSTESTSSSYWSCLAVDSDGDVHIAWYDYTDIGGADTDADIFYKEIVQDVAITDVTFSKTTATSGETISINVTAENKGTFNKTFTVTASYDNTEIGTQTVANLTSGASKNLNFTWDTTGLDADTYQIKAETSVITGETRTTDNTLTKSFTIIPITSTISITLSETTIKSGKNITISGSISPAREEVNVTIEYRTNEDWITLATVTTNDNGEYTYDWKPSKSGTYYLKASWEGDAITASAESTARTVQVKGKPFPIEYIIIIVVIIIIIAVLLIYYLKKRKPKEKIPKPAKFRITAEPTDIPADGKTTSTITIELLDKKGKPISALADTEVKLTSTSGKIEKPVIKILKGKESEKTVLVSSKEIGTVTLSADVKDLKSKKIKLTFKEKKRYCTHCGTKMPFKAKLCPECGRAPPAGVDTKVCKNCKAVIPIVAKFCGECGAGQPE